MSAREHRFVLTRAAGVKELRGTKARTITEQELWPNLTDFVYAGGGMMGVHGTSVAFGVLCKQYWAP